MLASPMMPRLSASSLPNPTRNLYRCEIAAFHGNRDSSSLSRDTLLKFARRKVENTESFNAVLVIPTGVGADIGGHAGDATPVRTATGLGL